MARKTTKRPKHHTFRLIAQQAGSVLLVGDFTDWQARGIRMHKDEEGVWMTSVELSPGKHRYRFIVDGDWRDDPECREHVANPFGGLDMLREAA